MPRRRKKRPVNWFRKNISLPERQREVVESIPNFSKFVQLAIDNAAGLMAWDAIKREKGLQDKEKLEDELPVYNKNNPVNKLTATRMPPSESSPPKQELW